ncbi:calcineurin-binding protein cabin-1 [Microplitis demolitor]|uniref:calcineurin-binding protein cabin-1 n=1 Tax=Microplitis demolitor TaxID=69319 RepID=UPI0004CC9E5F|nr:calcineurin-binding protein cabin-1 [Microplitis demolitor]XP_008547465.1 calcineurin-binding protein cabin-1 [Microplitis demolitor]
MMKISALNEESSEESDEENTPTITKEAQEQIALSEYNKALELRKENKIEDALSIFKDLLETELLDQVEKPEVPDGRARPMLSLKYCCFKNIGAIYGQMENYEEAINNYWEAANLDATDVMLWCRMGTLAMKTSNLEFACSAFKQGLNCNPNHWPCLDNIITATYAVPDYMNCLLYISMALERDSSYIKGLAFREQIYKEVPYFEESYKLFNVDWALDPPLDTEFDRVIGDALIAEAKEIAGRWVEFCKPEFEYKPLPDLSLHKPLKNYSWLELGESLVDMHKYMSDNNLNFISKIKLDIQTDETEALANQNSTEAEEKGENSEMVVDISSELESVTDVEMDVKGEHRDSGENDDDQEVPDAKLDSEMDVDGDDEKSSSSDVHIIEDEDPLKMESDIEQIDQAENKLQDSIVFHSSAVYDEVEILKSSESANENTEKSIEEIQDKSDSKVESADKNDGKPVEKCGDKASKSDDKPSDKSEGKEEQQKVKKRRRSSLCFLQQWAWSSSSMRRSARVRGSNRREAERDDVQLEEMVRRIFPPNLLPDTAKIVRDDPTKSMDDSMDTMDLYQLFERQENVNNEESKSSSPTPSPDSDVQKYFGTETERNQVIDFVNQHSGKNNLMIIIAKYTELMSTKWNHEWPKELPEIYKQAYLFTREHIPHSSPFGDASEEDSILKYDAEMTLLFSELHTDKWLDNKPEVLPSATVDKFGTGIPSEELGYIIFASVRDNLLNEENLIFLLRVLWVKASIFLCQGDTEIAKKSLELLLHDMKEFKQYFPTLLVKLPNCKHNSRIALPIVQKRLTSIERGQKLGEVQKLHEEKKFYELSLILKDTFKFAKQQNDSLTNVKLNIDRKKQLSMLLESLWQLEQYEDCFVWAETCLHEAWQCYNNFSDETDQKKWGSSVLNCLEKLESCVDISGSSVVRYLAETKASRLVQTLVQILCHQLDVPDTAVEMPLESVTPWILLHHILQYEDDRERAKSRTTSKSKAVDDPESDSDDEDKDIPAPIMLLFVGHDFLGRHSWCCINEAKLLLFTIKTVIPRMCSARYTAVREKITKHLEKMFWCLYGHPNRANKTKPKHLEDHGVPQIPLTWEIAQLLFEFYKPDVLPEFDTPRAMSISADTKILFKKINSLVPRDHDPSGIVDEINSYIVGDIEKMPKVKKPLPYKIDSLYYLLGDYSFKNNNWLSAAKYYSMDVCLHPDAFNSWVALAMSVSTLMGTTLNNCKPLSDITKLLSQAKIAQCCYQHAVELKPGHSVIWIEYGNFVYMVHSFCSRLLKQESDTLSMEKFEILEKRKEDTLDIAANCFNSANRIYLANIDDAAQMQDERWLYHYMLAKISEKKNHDPPVFLEHYATASELLHRNNAHYPKKISHKNAHYLSIEALEVHYRIHASILKYLEQHESKPLKKSLGELFWKCLLDCASGPFMQFQSKLSKNKRRDESNSDDIDYKIPVKESVENTEIVPKSGTNLEKRPNSVEEIAVVEKTTETNKLKTDKKRPREPVPDESSKRIKMGNVSHLQLMQDVLSLIDDLIINVCDVVTQNESTQKDSDEVMVISSDEGDCARTSKTRNEYEKTRAMEKRCEEDGKSKNAQEIMNTLMKQNAEYNKTQVSFHDNNQDVNKNDSKWQQADDVQSNEDSHAIKDKDDKVNEKKKSQSNSTKEEATISRRGSQESTTTTLTTSTTETNNSSYSSSDESSSSSDDSSSSDSSSDSDSESSDSDAEKKKSSPSPIEEKEEYYTDGEVARLISYCLAGLEQCVLRFPEHYKSIYRLCHFYFNHKTAKDNDKCRDLLLGTYKCQYYADLSFQGLFADRKTTNFFNGVWRIPNDEIDRPGSFASHMSRCVHLLMQVLKETDDSRMLMELCIHLRKTPDADKKYVRDSEREQLSRQALTLCLQSLRTRVQSMGPSNPNDSTQLCRVDPRTRVLLDVYKIYQQVSKNFQGKEVQAFATLLVDTYKAYRDMKTSAGNLLEDAMRFCQQQNLANKIVANQTSQQTQNLNQNQTIPTPPVTSAVTFTPVTQSQPIPTSPQTFQQRKTNKNPGTGRPRGRPPNVNKYYQNIMNSYSNNKRGFGNFLGTSNQPLMNPFFMNPLMDQSAMMSMLSSGLANPNMMDSLTAVNYLNQMGNYQDLLRQCQSNLTSMPVGSLGNFGNLPTSLPNVSSVPTMTTSSMGSVPSVSSGNLGAMSSLGNLTVQQFLNLSAAVTAVTTATTSSAAYNQSNFKTTTAGTNKELPHGISISAIGGTAQQQKTKTKHSSVNSDLNIHSSKSMSTSQQPKAAASNPQVSLLKPSVIQPTKTGPPKQVSAPQIRVSKSLTEPQPAHSSSLSVSPLKSASPSGIMNIPPPHQNLGNSGLNITPVPMGLSSRSGTSLQHKLQLKKQAQQAPPNPVKKQRPSSKTAQAVNNISNVLKMPTSAVMMGVPYLSTDLSGISVSPVNSSSSKSSVKPMSFRKGTSKPKSVEMTAMPASLSQSSTAETINMLTQLQQHSHLEIIPQAKTHSKSTDYIKNPPLSLSVVPPKAADNIRSTIADTVTMFDIPRGKTSSSTSKADKHAKESVEIITLDD